MSSMANRLNNTGVTCSELASIGGIYDVETKCYRFPDGSSGRLIAFRLQGVELNDSHNKFIALRVAR